MKKFKRFFCVLLLFALSSGLMLQARAEVNLAGVDPENEDYGPEIFGETYCVIDGDTGEVLMGRGKDTAMYPASTTKIMTALLVCENVEDLNAKLTFTRSAVDLDPSSSTLEPRAEAGEVMTVKDALYGMLLRSANECAAMLGEYVAGSREAFAEMMNQRALEIGCKNTHFVNAHGFHDDQHYSTAYDLCLILRTAMENPVYRELNGTKNYTIAATNLCGARSFGVGHQMLSGAIIEEGVIGGKTGTTPQAGCCLTTAVDRDGLYTISVIMHSDDANRYKDEQVLLEYAYGFHNQTLPPYKLVKCKDTVICHNGVRLRYSPSLLSGYLMATGEGLELKRVALYGEWSKVKYEGKYYFVSTEYLESKSPEKVPETEAFVYPEVTEIETIEETSESATADGTGAEESSPSEEIRNSETSEITQTPSSDRTETQSPESESRAEEAESSSSDMLIIIALSAAAVILFTTFVILILKLRKNH